MLTPPTEHQSTLHHHTVSWTREVAAGAPGGPGAVGWWRCGGPLPRQARLRQKRGRDGAKYSKFHPRGYLSHHLAAISMAAVYTDAAHIADGVIGLQQRSLAASGPTE